jgi:hypothetical protein
MRVAVSASIVERYLAWCIIAKSLNERRTERQVRLFRNEAAEQ